MARDARSDFVVVGDERDGLALGMKFLDQPEHITRAFRIEIAGWFVGQQQGRAQDQRARNRRALHLPTRQLRRTMVHAISETDARQQFLRTCRHVRLWLARETQRQQHILKHGEARQQVETLEDETDLAVAHGTDRFIVQRRHLDTVEHIRARVRLVEAAEHVQQRRLARARGTGDRDEFARSNMQRHAVEGAYVGAVHGVGLGDVLYLDHSCVPAAKRHRPEGAAKVPQVPPAGYSHWSCDGTGRSCIAVKGEGENINPLSAGR